MNTVQVSSVKLLTNVLANDDQEEAKAPSHKNFVNTQFQITKNASVRRSTALPDLKQSGTKKMTLIKGVNNYFISGAKAQVSDPTNQRLSTPQLKDYTI